MDFGRNFFEIFNLPAAYSLDRELLRSSYMTLQKKFHPDRHILSSDTEKRLAMQLITEINTGYETLSDNLQRAIYLLELNGNEVEETPKLDNEVLLKQIEFREDLEILENRSESRKSLGSFRAEIDAQIENIQVALEQAFLADSFGVARQLVYEQQFFFKLERSLERIEEKSEGI